MKFAKTLLLSLTACILAGTMLLTYGFSADGEVKPRRIELYQDSKKVTGKTITLRLDKEITLDYEITPEDANIDTDVTWRSDNKRVATVEDDGTVFAEGYGDCTIYVKTKNGKSASCRIHVPGSSSRSYDYDYSSSSYRASSSTSQADPTVQLTERVPREVMLESIRLGNDGQTLTLSNYVAVSAESLQAAATLGAGSVRFETKINENAVGSVTITPSLVGERSGSIQLGVYCGTEQTKKIQSTFDKHFKNSSVVILCQQKEFDMPVRITAKASKLKGDNLHVYSYDTSSKKYSKVEVKSASRDSNGFVSFTTSSGGCFIVSDGPLVAQ